MIEIKRLKKISQHDSMEKMLTMFSAEYLFSGQIRTALTSSLYT